jgi:hypothetical protein
MMEDQIMGTDVCHERNEYWDRSVLITKENGLMLKYCFVVVRLRTKVVDATGAWGVKGRKLVEFARKYEMVMLNVVSAVGAARARCIVNV